MWNSEYSYTVVHIARLSHWLTWCQKLAGRASSLVLQEPLHRLCRMLLFVFLKFHTWGWKHQHSTTTWAATPHSPQFTHCTTFLSLLYKSQGHELFSLFAALSVLFVAFHCLLFTLLWLTGCGCSTLKCAWSNLRLMAVCFISVHITKWY